MTVVAGLVCQCGLRMQFASFPPRFAAQRPRGGQRLHDWRPTAIDTLNLLH